MNYNVEQHKGPFQWLVTIASLAFFTYMSLIQQLQIVLV